MTDLATLPPLPAVPDPPAPQATLPDTADDDPIAVMRANLLFWRNRGLNLRAQMEAIHADPRRQSEMDTLARRYVECVTRSQAICVDLAPYRYPRMQPAQ